MCATTKKAKACKDCSCGLAEELEAASKLVAPKPDTSNAKSSCGSVSKLIFFIFTMLGMHIIYNIHSLVLMQAQYFHCKISKHYCLPWIR